MVRCWLYGVIHREGLESGKDLVLNKIYPSPSLLPSFLPSFPPHLSFLPPPPLLPSLSCLFLSLSCFVIKRKEGRKERGRREMGQGGRERRREGGIKKERGKDRERKGGGEGERSGNYRAVLTNLCISSPVGLVYCVFPEGMCQ